MNKTSRATIIFPRDLWRDFMVHAKLNDTTASKLIRAFVQRTIEEAKMEQD